MDVYKRIFDQMPDGLLVVDQGGVVFRANAQAARMFGYSNDELCGTSVEALMPQSFRERHLEHRRRFMADPHSRPMGADLELFARRADCSEFPVDIMLSPLEGSPRTTILCVVRDVTDRRRAEQRFRSLLEAAPDAMVIANTAGHIQLVNSQTERVFGYPRQELLGKSVHLLIAERCRAQNPMVDERRSGATVAWRARESPRELFGLRRDGEEFPVEISVSPLQTKEGTLILSAVRDISERKRIEHILESLNEKELMLKEIHHRVKNNLAVISSLFYMQSTYTSDEPTIKILRESQDRVRSMSLVHETLYRSENLAAIDFGAYAQDLSERLFRTYGATGGKIRLITQLDPVSLGIDQAIPCGLILNELITNAFAHGFPGERQGEIRVQVGRGAPAEMKLSVCDDGVGFPAGLDIEHANTLGLRLIRALTRQIDGRFEIRRVAVGTAATLDLEIARC